MQGISFGFLDFQRIPVERMSVSGHPYTVWTPIGMPRIPDNIIDSSFFLYANHNDAEKGINPGGTGFLVGIGGNLYERNLTFYAVTNHHVACSGGSSIIRLNKPDGGVQIIDLDPLEWQFKAGGADIAAVTIDFDGNSEPISFIPISLFASEQDVDRNHAANIFVGDDTFMIGMFYDHQAKTKNIPAARFGNISMLPDKDALAKQATGYRGKCFVVDMHSRTGFSGSPVFAFRTFGSDLGDGSSSAIQKNVRLDYRYKPGEAQLRGMPENRDASVPIRNQLKLIGIQCGQFPEYWPVKGDRISVPKPESINFLPPGEYIDGVSGMTQVIPAWEIREFLNMQVFQDQRTQKALKQTFDSSPRPEVVPRATDANPTHQEDFNRLLNVAAKTPPQAD